MEVVLVLVLVVLHRATSSVSPIKTKIDGTSNWYIKQIDEFTFQEIFLINWIMVKLVLNLAYAFSREFIIKIQDQVPFCLTTCEKHFLLAQIEKKLYWMKSGSNFEGKHFISYVFLLCPSHLIGDVWIPEKRVPELCVNTIEFTAEITRKLLIKLMLMLGKTNCFRRNLKGNIFGCVLFRHTEARYILI